LQPGGVEIADHGEALDAHRLVVEHLPCGAHGGREHGGGSRSHDPPSDQTEHHTDAHPGRQVSDTCRPRVRIQPLFDPSHRGAEAGDRVPTRRWLANRSIERNPEYGRSDVFGGDHVPPVMVASRTPDWERSTAT